MNTIHVPHLRKGNSCILALGVTHHHCLSLYDVSSIFLLFFLLLVMSLCTKLLSHFFTFSVDDLRLKFIGFEEKGGKKWKKSGTLSI